MDPCAQLKADYQQQITDLQSEKSALEAEVARLKYELANKPAQVERHHNQYVTVTATNEKAWVDAHAKVGAKYPGSVQYLKMAERVKNLILAGEEFPEF